VLVLDLDYQAKASGRHTDSGPHHINTQSRPGYIPEFVLRISEEAGSLSRLSRINYRT
jgi:hypothetical protein